MKMSANDLVELRRLCPDGNVPEWPSPDSNAAYDIEAAVQGLLEKERARKGLKKMSVARRAFYGISTLNTNVKGDGLATGVATNDPELLEAAIDGAKAMKIAALAKILTKAKRSFPPQDTWKSFRKRCAWFETTAGQKAAAKLEDLSDEFMDAEGEPGFVARCLKFALANPTEFFETEAKKSKKRARHSKR